MSKVVYETEWTRYRLDERRINGCEKWRPVLEGGGYYSLNEARIVADLCADEDPDMQYRVVDLEGEQ